ncbi:MAG: STAS domain-containing protein [Desulfosoma sp.]
MAFSVTWEQDGTGRIVLDGILDRDTVPEVRRRLFRAVLSKRPRRLFLNLSTVERMDTAGLALLVELRNAATRQGGAFYLEEVPESVQRLIGLARLENLLASPNQGPSGQ